MNTTLWVAVAKVSIIGRRYGASLPGFGPGRDSLPQLNFSQKLAEEEGFILLRSQFDTVTEPH